MNRKAQLQREVKKLMRKAGLSQDQLALNVYAKLPEAGRKPYNHYRKWVRRLCDDGFDRVDQRTRPLLEHVAALLGVSDIAVLWGGTAPPSSWDRKLLDILNFDVESLEKDKRDIFIRNRDSLLDMIEGGTLFIQRKGKSLAEQKSSLKDMQDKDLRALLSEQTKTAKPSWSDGRQKSNEPQSADKHLSPFTPEESEQFGALTRHLIKVMRQLRSEAEFWDSMIEVLDFPTIYRSVLRALSADRDVAWIQKQLRQMVADVTELE